MRIYRDVLYNQSKKIDHFLKKKMLFIKLTLKVYLMLCPKYILIYNKLFSLFFFQKF